MDSKKIKKISDLLKYGDGKFLVVENGEPAFVVMDVEMYKELKHEQEEENFDPQKFMNDINWDDDDYRNYDYDMEDFGDRIGRDDDFIDDFGNGSQEEYQYYNENYGDRREDEYLDDEDEGFAPSEIPFEEPFSPISERKRDDIRIEEIRENGRESQNQRPKRINNFEISDIPF